MTTLPPAKAGFRAAATAVLLLLAAACDSNTVGPRAGTPVLYLMADASATATAEVGSGADARRPSDQTAFLFVMDEDGRLRYARAERFEVARVADGASFGWRHRDREGTRVFTDTFPAAEANYVLEGQEGLGPEALEPGTELALEVRVGGRTLTGRVTVPAAVEPRLERKEDGTVAATWAAAAGAAGYQVLWDGGHLLRGEPGARLPAELAPGAEVAIRALGPSAFRYLADPSGGRAGLEGGLGLFGTRTTVVVRAP